MKKIIFLLFLFIIVKLDAQYMVKSTIQATLGVGISNYGAPQFLGVDYGLFRDLSLGVEFSNRYSNETFKKYRIIGSQANVNYHLKIYDEHWDLYAGGQFNYWLVTENIKNIELDSATSGFGGQLGMHYFFNRHFAVNTELGCSTMGTKHFLRNESSIVGSFKLGLTYKFR
jgi:outer membrane immunogenic protein